MNFSQQKIYDYVVVGASVAGIVFAFKKTEAKKTVLLTNSFGFPGGSITELLNCNQVVESLPQNSLTAKIYNSAVHDNFGSNILNPETVKYELQHELESSGVELYFHVTPKAIIQKNDIHEITFLAKEGDISINATTVIDATDDYSTAILANGMRISKEHYIHLFITPPANTTFLSFHKISNAIQLKDGRYWLSLTIDSTDDLFIEHRAHEILDSFRFALEASQSRIQILPIGTHSLFEFKKKQSNTVITLDDISGNTFTIQQQFQKCLSVEDNCAKY